MSSPANWTWQDWIEVTRKHGKLLAGTALAGALAAGIASFVVTPVYEASALLQVDSGADQAFLLSAEPMLNRQNEIFTQVELAKSRSVLDRVCVRMGCTGTGEEALSAEILRGKVNPSPLRNTNLLSITVSDSNPERARDLANAVAGALSEASVERKQMESRRIREFLDEQVIKVRQELERSEANLSPRSVKVNEEVYRLLLSKRHEANIAENSQIGDVVIVDPAVAPRKPVRPKKAFNILLGLVLGGLVGVLGAVWKENQADSISDLEELEALSPAPVLGWIPQIPVAEGDDWLSRPAALLREEESARQLEPYRLLTTNLELLPSDSPRKIVLVTSALPQEGKTRTSACLALAMAREGKKVLLVEADMRRPGLSSQWGMPGVGLAEVLAGKSKLDECIGKIGEGNTSLSVLFAGSPPSNPAELLNAEALNALFGEIRGKFDVAMVDSSPVMLTPDALKLALFTDGILFIVQAERTPRKVFDRALKQFERAQAKVLGVVLNRVAKPGSAYGYGYGYGGYGGYYYSRRPGQEHPAAKG